MRIFLLCVLFVSPFVLTAQGDGERGRFEDRTPLRELRCGLWINASGSLAYKDIAAAPPDIADSVDVVDNYITWTYDYRDSLDDYMTGLCDVIDTASFEFMGRFYMKDRNHIYFYQPMAYGGQIFVTNGIDRASFRTFPDHSTDFFACDKDNCYALSRRIDGADPPTFRPVEFDGYVISRDRNHVYNWTIPLDDEDLDEFDDPAGMSLRKVLQKEERRYNRENKKR